MRNRASSGDIFIWEELRDQSLIQQIKDCSRLNNRLNSPNDSHMSVETDPHSESLEQTSKPYTYI